MSDGANTRYSAIAPYRRCPECGFEAIVAVDRIYVETNLVRQGGQTLARWAYYECPSRHVQRIPYNDAMIGPGGTLAQLIDRLKK